MIQIQDVEKRYGNTRVLEGVTLTVPRGETVSLIGPSGCGKSTLLRIVMGLMPSDSGKIVINEEPVTEHNIQKLRRQMGYVIQSGGLFPHLTARENLTLVTSYLSWEKERETNRIKELCELTGIQYSYLDRRPDGLSGGQAQRISLMRALMLDPDIILLDEPLGSIDPLVRYELQRDLKSIFKKLQKTVLLVTHDLGEAGYLGDRIALMESGTLVQEGEIKEIINHPENEFVERFVNAQRSPLEDV